jgi:hypothetical protein
MGSFKPSHFGEFTGDRNMVAVTRYDIAQTFKGHWNQIIWKGDKKTQGVYFDQQYGYLIDRPYAVRMQHDECSPPVFYIPDLIEDEDEVVKRYPYKNMENKTRKYKELFAVSTLKEIDLAHLFDGDYQEVVTVQIKEMKEFLERIPVKRVRDRTLITIVIGVDKVSAILLDYKKEEYSVIDSKAVEPISIGSSNITLSLNANTLLHALCLFSSSSTVTFSKSSDRIKVTSNESCPKVEAVISTPTEAPKIERNEQVTNHM